MEPWQYKPARDHGLPMLQQWRSVKRESGLIGRSLHRMWSRGIASYLQRCHRLQVAGKQHLPTEPPFILIANHASHLDALVLATILPAHLRGHVFPVAAGDTFFETHRHAAFAAGLMNALPMWRKNCGRHALGELRQRVVDDRCGLILFPEGTRSRTGEMAPFKPGLGMMVAGSAVPIIPCYLHGTFDAWPPLANRPRRGAPVRVAVGPAMEFSTIANNRIGWADISQRLEQAVRQLGKVKGSAPAVPGE